MADSHDTDYLSIGEVLGLLLEEYPDVTISKIRFLESQGLISPERTPSGYRKFRDDDVQLLRVILAEQRENYLPLRVIKDRLETGEIDPTGEHLRPNGDHHHDDDHHHHDDHADANGLGTHFRDEPVEAADVPPASISSHPAARHRRPIDDVTPADPSADGDRTTIDATAEDGAAESDGDDDTPDGVPAPTQLLPGVLLDRGELCAMVGMTDEELSQLESFGVVVPRESTGIEVYGEDAVEIARPACEFLRSGVDARHLRNWRTSADREALLFEQLVAPRFRQRNPEARAEALEQLRRLDQLGGQLRAAMTRHALRHHFDG